MNGFGGSSRIRCIGFPHLAGRGHPPNRLEGPHTTFVWKIHTFGELRSQAQTGTLRQGKTFVDWFGQQTKSSVGSVRSIGLSVRETGRQFVGSIVQEPINQRTNTPGNSQEIHEDTTDPLGIRVPAPRRSVCTVHLFHEMTAGSFVLSFAVYYVSALFAPFDLPNQLLMFSGARP